MDRKDEFNLFIDEMINCAYKEFADTEEYSLLREKLDKMHRDCEGILTRDEQVFVNECFELLLDVSGRQEQFVYRKGLRDSVSFLKWVGVLA